MLGTNPEILGNDPVTTATAVVPIHLTDINDNCPLFDERAYSVNVYENIAEGSNIRLQMTVTDKDTVKLCVNGCMCVCISACVCACACVCALVHVCVHAC